MGAVLTSIAKWNKDLYAWLNDIIIVFDPLTVLVEETESESEDVYDLVCVSNHLLLRTSKSDYNFFSVVQSPWDCLSKY